MSKGALAQVSNMQLRLLENPELLEQLQSEAMDAGQANVATGIPSANSPSVQNTTNLVSKENINTKFSTLKTMPSVIENYYQILTGADLSVYGSKEFSQDQDDSLLFFNTFGAEYRLAPGDVLRINLRGFIEKMGPIKLLVMAKLF